jgi:hypothetical protein
MANWVDQDLHVVGRKTDMPIETAIPLFESGRVPRHVIVQQVTRGLLEVEPFGGGVGSDEHAQRACRVVECLLHLLPHRGRVHVAVEHLDALGLLVALGHAISSCARRRPPVLYPF